MVLKSIRQFIAVKRIKSDNAQTKMKGYQSLARNGSKSMMKVWPPFISFEGNEPSTKAKEIYKKASTQSIKCQI